MAWLMVEELISIPTTSTSTLPSPNLILDKLSDKYPPPQLYILKQIKLGGSQIIRTNYQEQNQTQHPRSSKVFSFLKVVVFESMFPL